MHLVSHIPRWTSVPICRWVAAGLMAGLIGGCRPAPLPEVKPLRVAIDLWPGYYPLVIAQAQGYLAAEGVTVELRLPEDTHRMIAEFAANEHDLICVSLGDVVLTTRVQPDIRMILCSDESAGGDQLLARPGPAGPRDFRGCRIGTTLGGFGELFVRRFLESRGLQPDEVTIINVDAAQVPEMLQRGELDLGHTWEPYAEKARSMGFAPVFTSLETPGAILDGLIAHESVIKLRQAEVQGLVRAWFRGVEWWRAHEAAGNALVEARLKLEPGGVSLRGIRLLGREDNRRVFNPGTPEGSLSQATQDFVEFFVSRGLLGRRLKPEELLDARFIE